jgi:hypothetical protein
MRRRLGFGRLLPVSTEQQVIKAAERAVAQAKAQAQDGMAMARTSLRGVG